MDNHAPVYMWFIAGGMSLICDRSFPIMIDTPVSHAIIADNILGII